MLGMEDRKGNMLELFKLLINEPWVDYKKLGANLVRVYPKLPPPNIWTKCKYLFIRLFNKFFEVFEPEIHPFARLRAKFENIHPWINFAYKFSALF